MHVQFAVQLGFNLSTNFLILLEVLSVCASWLFICCTFYMIVYTRIITQPVLRCFVIRY